MFIRVTDKDAGLVSINVNHIVSFAPSDDVNQTTVNMCEDNFYIVNENFEQITNLISAATLARARLLNFLE